jgi:hypothetical protein
MLDSSGVTGYEVAQSGTDWEYTQAATQPPTISNGPFGPVVAPVAACQMTSPTPGTSAVPVCDFAVTLDNNGSQVASDTWHFADTAYIAAGQSQSYLIYAVATWTTSPCMSVRCTRHSRRRHADLGLQLVLARDVVQQPVSAGQATRIIGGTCGIPELGCTDRIPRSPAQVLSTASCRSSRCRERSRPLAGQRRPRRR